MSNLDKSDTRRSEACAILNAYRDPLDFTNSDVSQDPPSL